VEGSIGLLVRLEFQHRNDLPLLGGAAYDLANTGGKSSTGQGQQTDGNLEHFGG